MQVDQNSFTARRLLRDTGGRSRQCGGVGLPVSVGINKKFPELFEVRLSHQFVFFKFSKLKIVGRSNTNFCEQCSCFCFSLFFMFLHFHGANRPDLGNFRNSGRVHTLSCLKLKCYFLCDEKLNASASMKPAEI